METCTDCGKDFDPEEDAVNKKTLLRRKLDYITDEVADQVNELFNLNHAIGQKPDNWKDTDTTEKLSAMLIHCSSFDKIFATSLKKEWEVLYDAAELMDADEFEYIQKTDEDLVELLLNGPQQAFCFPLDKKCRKRVRELRMERES